MLGKSYQIGREHPSDLCLLLIECWILFLMYQKKKVRFIKYIGRSYTLYKHQYLYNDQGNLFNDNFQFCFNATIL